MNPTTQHVMATLAVAVLASVVWATPAQASSSNSAPSARCDATTASGDGYGSGSTAAAHITLVQNQNTDSPGSPSNGDHAHMDVSGAGASTASASNGPDSQKQPDPRTAHCWFPAGIQYTTGPLFGCSPGPMTNNVEVLHGAYATAGSPQQKTTWFVGTRSIDGGSPTAVAFPWSSTFTPGMQSGRAPQDAKPLAGLDYTFTFAGGNSCWGVGSLATATA